MSVSTDGHKGDELAQLAAAAAEANEAADAAKPKRKKQRLSSVNKRKRFQPVAIRDRAMEMFANGHAIPDIARAIGVDPSTVRRWSYASGVTFGQALSLPQIEEQKEDPFAVLGESPTQRLLSAEGVTAAIQEAIDKPGDAAAKYQAAMVGLGLRMLKEVAAVPPQVRTIKDLSILNDVMRKSLGLTDRVGGGKLAINLNVLTKSARSETVEAEVVNVDADEDSSGD